MNLQPLYTVKERLEQAAIAGTGLLGEDFRLQRAAEGLKPLAAASPVFAKIDSGLQALLAAPAEERGGLLLDLLALVDAVAYTQGKTGADGDLEPLPAGNGVCLELSYAQLHPLLEALTGSGGGRMKQIQAVWEDHPEFFGDYRVLPVLIDHLGESYAELADLMFAIAKAQGPVVIPLLKQGFDPAGKRDMARRVQLMDAVSGPAENDWYLEQLPQSKKTVREALIFALRHTPSNLQALLDLCQTEKKDCLAAAHWALARLDHPDAASYWMTLAAKDPNQVLDFMRSSPTQTAASVTVQLFTQTLEPLGPDCPLDETLWSRLGKLTFALDGKTGPEVCQVYRQCAALGTALDRDVEYEQNGRKKREPMGFWSFAGGGDESRGRRPFHQAVPDFLLHSIQLTRDPGLCALADELFEQYGGPWAASALCAALFTLDREQAYLRGEEILRSKRKLFTGDKRVNEHAALKDVTWALWWNKDTDTFEYILSALDPADANRAPRSLSNRPALPYPLDPRWYNLLMEAGGLDASLRNLIRPVDHPVMEKVRKYFHYKATRCGDYQKLRECISVLKTCGHSDWEDFVPACVKRMGEIQLYLIEDILNQLPISGPEKAKQLRAVNDLVWSKQVRVRGGRWPELQINNILSNWENQS